MQLLDHINISLRYKKHIWSSIRYCKLCIFYCNYILFSHQNMTNLGIASSANKQGACKSIWLLYLSHASFKAEQKPFVDLQQLSGFVWIFCDIWFESIMLHCELCNLLMFEIYIIRVIEAFNEWPCKEVESFFGGAVYFRFWFICKYFEHSFILLGKGVYGVNYMILLFYINSFRV